MAHAIRQDIQSASELLAFSEVAAGVRRSHRVLAICDVMRGEKRPYHFIIKAAREVRGEPRGAYVCT